MSIIEEFINLIYRIKLKEVKQFNRMITKQKQNMSIMKVHSKLKQKQRQLKEFKKKLQQQMQQSSKNPNNTPYCPWISASTQTRLQNSKQLSILYNNNQTYPQQFQQQQQFSTKQLTPYDHYNKFKQTFKIKQLLTDKYYPSSCIGYDITYCEQQMAIYIYGGISCQTVLEDGIKPYFYKYYQGKWQQIKHQSIYCPITRYGHTLSCYQRDLILFGGVSQYKLKLRDRCFYSDLSVFNTIKNQWKIVQTTGNFRKTRKNHATCMLGKYLFVYGGIDQNQQIINDMSWINYQNKKPIWKSITKPGRYNHKIIPFQYHKKDFLAIFGGRDQNSQIINTLSIIQMNVIQGQVLLKDPINIPNQMAPRQMLIMQPFSHGFIIFGGNNENNEVVNDTWYYNTEKQTFQKLELQLDYNQLRGCHGVRANYDKIYILASNSCKYKALEIQIIKT